MRQRSVKRLILVTLTGTLLQLSCLSSGSLRRVLIDGALFTGWELLLDGGIEGFNLVGGGEADGG